MSPKAKSQLGQLTKLWLLGGLVGAVAGIATLGFRQAILTVQHLAFQERSEHLASAVATLPHWWVLIAPLSGGIVVAILLFIANRSGALKDTRSHGVADVIEARALSSGRIGFRAGVYSVAIASVTLGTGGSAGREGPAVHLGASIASVFSRRLNLTARDSRTLLACGAAAAVAASFNAPLAGMVFALEVVLGHYALRVMAPTAFAATLGALIARQALGAQPAFSIPAVPPVTPVDFPAAIVLGIFCGILAMVFSQMILKGPATVRNWANKVHYPLWALPPIGGLIVGCVAIFWPEILGVSYEATALALDGHFPVSWLILLLITKMFATVVTISFRGGGGVFSPAVFLGAITGSMYGTLLGHWLGNSMANSQFFAIVGMGALTGAVLGAPISTTLIVFELTGSYEASIAVLLAVSIATAVSQSVMGANIYQKQIQARAKLRVDGPQRVILQTVRVRDFMTPVGEGEQRDSPTKLTLFEDDTLGRALGLMDAEDVASLPVRTRTDEQRLVGYVSKSDALIAYNRRLIEEHEERID